VAFSLRAAVHVCPDDVVAGACAAFEFVAVVDLEVSANVADQALFVKAGGDSIEGLASYAEHI